MDIVLDFGSDYGLFPGRRQAIIWTNAGILLIRTLGINFSEILSKIHIFSCKKMHLKASSAKCRPFCLGLSVLTLSDSDPVKLYIWNIYIHVYFSMHVMITICIIDISNTMFFKIFSSIFSVWTGCILFPKSTVIFPAKIFSWSVMSVPLRNKSHIFPGHSLEKKK